MSNPQIVTSPLSSFSAKPSPEALERKGELLELASMLVAVESEEDQMEAIDAAAQIKAIEKGVESTREAVKAPFLAAGREIDDCAKKFIKELVEERKRIEGLLTKFALEQQREHQRKLEIQRKEEEERAQAIREEQELQQAEYKRELAEAAAANRPEPAAPAPVVAPEPIVMPEAPKMEGASLRIEKDYVVTDIHALYQWNKSFVKLQDDRAFLKAWVNRPENDHSVVPGIRIFDTAKTVTRATRSREVRVIEDQNPFE